MSPRTLARFAAPLTALALLASAAPATAAPRVGSVDAVIFETDGRTSGYVAFNIEARGASHVRINWRGKGSARQRVSGGRVGIGFARRGARSFRVSVRACRRNRCSRARRFSGRFRVVRRSTEPPPNSPPVDRPPVDPSLVNGFPVLPVPAAPVETPGTQQPAPVSAPSY